MQNAAPNPPAAPSPAAPSPAAPATPPQRATPPRERELAGVNPSLRAIKPEAFGYEQARHLLWRAGFGGTPAQIQTLVSWGPERSVDYLLDADKVPFDAPGDDAFDRNIQRPPTEEERRVFAEARRRSDEDTLAQIRLERQRREREDRLQMAEIQKWWLRRMIETPRPLEEKLTLFWHGHFATSFRTIENSYHMYLQNRMLRDKALGSFGDLLTSIIRDPAMLAYLDNNDSRRGRPNENLAREIMELFALGLGNYSEQDIKEGARALTGYTFEDDAFVFRQANHDNGGKRILGQSGNMNGDDFCRAILAHRACAPFITSRLYHFFLADVPSDEQGGWRSLPRAQREAVSELAASLRSNEYQLRPMLRRLFLSEHFYSPRFMNDQVKSPAMLVVGAVRSLNTPVRDLAILNDAMDLMGQSLFMPPSVKGWEGGRSWINTSTLFVRQNLMAFLLTGKKPVGYDASADTQRYDPATLLADLERTDPRLAKDPDAVIDYLLRLTLGHSPSHARQPLREFLAAAGDEISRDSLTGLLLLMTAMPEYQLC